ncbi:unnamed protein product [Microthlaspi erraticum]|uniref:Reverse transcriptase domain-containing protein n=1 Tax=Microthlaspi erraticum TaxID=1685480 RepID=A0A6D2JZK7_9BRAS|nr:unnamed protein product [Microthlaspi erraticum]
MANSEWHSQYPTSETHFLEMGEYDHRPLVTFISATSEERRSHFMYDSRMFQKEGFKDAVLKGWRGNKQLANEERNLASRISQSRKEISIWKKKNRCNSHERITLLRHQLDKAMRSSLSSTQERNRLREELNQAYKEEEIFLKQKSCNQWLRSGDRNTKYFHSVARTRRQRNQLKVILDENGTVHRGDNAIGDVAESYFQQLFSSQVVNSETFDKVFEGFQPRVSNATNLDLTREVSMKEIEDAVFSVGPHRAPEPDGFSGVFYHQFWDEIKAPILQEIQGFFQRGVLDPSHNQTNICLIPKVTQPDSMVDFRPISLCNVSYKIISKILVNRLKTHLSGIISENQAAFIPRRMITDNVIIAHEMFYALKSRKRQAKSYMALKTDMTKAYDRLEWSILEETMKHMGFDQKWIQWIMTAVSSVQFQVLINGSPKGLINPERGIRQGDPLSPYLFILCAKVLSHMMHQAGIHHEIPGLQIDQGCPKINHLLFADDSLFFSLANIKSAKAIKEVLTLYENASGQAVNLRKSSITFGSQVKPHVNTHMRRLLGIHNEGANGKYLEVPEQFGNKKTEMFHYIVDKVKERTQGWHKQSLSTGGKEVLLKSIAIALPVYSMNVFKLPTGICEEINSVLAKFWWNTNEERKGMHWFAWKRLCLSKKEGGLGFRDIERFNLALLGKQAWRMLQHPNCLMARVMRGRYFRDGNILTATATKKNSFAWRSILQVRDLMRRE